MTADAYYKYRQEEDHNNHNYDHNNNNRSLRRPLCCSVYDRPREGPVTVDACGPKWDAKAIIIEVFYHNNSL